MLTNSDPALFTGPPFHLLPVTPTPKPGPSNPTKRVIKLPSVPIDGQWTEQWGERGATAEEMEAAQPQPDYQGFYDELISHPIYLMISGKAALFQPLLAASTEFIAAFADAKLGRPSPDAIRTTVWKMMYWMQPSAAETAILQSLLASHNLDTLYTLTPPPEVSAFFDSLPNPFKFYAGVLGSNVYQSKLIPIILAGTNSVPGDVTTIMGFAIKDAQAGLTPLPTPSAPPNAMQNAIWMWMSVIGPLLDQADIMEIQGLLDAANLGALYSLTPPAP